MQMGIAALPGLHFLLAVIGTLALCVTAGLAAKLPFMAWLTWLGEHSLAIYLFFTIPMSLTRALALKSGVVTDTGIVGVLVLVVSIASSVVLYALVQKTGIGKFLFERPRWAHLPERWSSQQASKSAATNKTNATTANP
jgi:uncharacterized membrane protein YcfT